MQRKSIERLNSGVIVCELTSLMYFVVSNSHFEFAVARIYVPARPLLVSTMAKAYG